MKFLDLTFLTFMSLSLSARADVIYGDDNRQEVFEAKASYQLLAQSVLSMISKKKIRTVKDILTLDQTNFGSGRAGTQAFCPSVRFTDQPSVAQCSGVLIAPDVVLTAGHCVLDENDCRQVSWVFHFSIDEASQKAGLAISPDDVYQCKRVISSVLNSTLGLDYGIVELDRKVVGRAPLRFRTKGKITQGEEVLVIGNPNGLPLKVADEAFVRDNGTLFNFTANLDTFTGNSGSPVFSAETGLIEGILVSGEDDFRMNPQQLCTEVKRCTDDECAGEGVTRILGIPEISLQKAFVAAAEEGDVDQVRSILALKTWIDFPDEKGRGPLYYAVENNQVEVVRLLVASGADPKREDVDGVSAMSLAQENGLSEILSLLIQK